MISRVSRVLSRLGSHLLLPPLASAHSHAFQRALRGAAERPADESGTADFWSWRAAMYRLASSLTPESIHRISRVAFRELHRAGVRTVGEFHYVHHQADGTPYDDRTVMSEAVVRAARDEGLRIALLRVAYHRAGPGREAEPAQRRFCDSGVDDVLRDVDSLRSKFASDPGVRVGIAPHSVRAVAPEWIRDLATHAEKLGVPLHMHVAEQPREVEECIGETGKRPVELLADLGALSDRFVAVHGTFLGDSEARLLGGARAFVCVCSSTEANLGDGLPDVGALRSSGVRLCTGVDSHVLVDPLADLRALETGERLRTGRRVTFTPEAGTPAEQLWREGSLEGARACGFMDAGEELHVAVDHPSLDLVADDCLLDAIVFGSPSSILEDARACSGLRHGQ